MLEQGRGALGKKRAGAGHFCSPQAEKAQELLPEPDTDARRLWCSRCLRRLHEKNGRSKGQTIGEAGELLDFKIESHRINAWGAAKRADGRSKGAAEGDIPSLVPFREHCIGSLKKAHRARHVPLEAKTLGSDGAEIAHLCKTYRLQAANIGFCTLAQGRELRRQSLPPQASLRERIFRYAERVALSRERQGLRPNLLA
jgi:hypothetical protein